MTIVRQRFALVFASVALLGLALGTGCGKKKAKKPNKTEKQDEMGPAAPSADMDVNKRRALKAGPMTATPPAMGSTSPAPSTPGPKGQAGALPIPHYLPAFHANVKAMRGTPLFKRIEGPAKKAIEGFMKTNPLGNALLTKCKVDPLKQLDSITFSLKLGRITRGDAIAVLKGTFKAPEVVACVQKVLAASKKGLAIKPTTLGKAKGFDMTIKGIPVAIFALGPNTVMLAGGALKADAMAVHQGKKGSLAGTKIYKDLMAKVKPTTVFTAVVPEIRIGNMPMSGMGGMMGLMLGALLRQLRQGAFVAGLPNGGLDLSLVLTTAKASTAASLASLLGKLTAGLAKGQFASLAPLAKKLIAKANGPKLMLSLALDKAELDKAIETFKGFGSKIRSMMGMGKMIK